MKRILTILAAASVAIAVALSFGATSMSPFSADGPELEPSDELVELGPVQLVMTQYNADDNIPCNQGQGQNSDFCSGNLQLTGLAGGIAVGNITSVTCADGNNNIVVTFNTCQANGGETQIQLNADVDLLPCQSIRFAIVTITLDNMDTLVINVGASNNPTGCSVNSI